MNQIEKLKQFHADTDRASLALETKHAARLHCRRGCASCCVDGITVWEIEAENIRQNHAELLANEQPNKAGGCAFLDAGGACRIYESRPYVCRTQGLPLRWFDEIDGEIFELRDICPLNEAGEPIEELEEKDCWTIGDFESRLAELQSAGGEMRRVRLRDLFQ